MAIAEKAVTGTKLPLDSLEIKGYRCFKELTIPKLARVNLITGKNNVGKTSLLEALYLYTKGGSAAALWDILTRREQLSLNDDNDLAMAVTGVRYCINGYPPIDLKQKPPHMVIGPLNSSAKRLDMALHWDRSHPNESSPVPQILITSPVQDYYPLEYVINKLARDFFRVASVVGGYFLRSTSLLRSDRRLMWDGIVLTEKKQGVIDGVKLVAGETVEDISLLGEVSDPLGSAPYVRIGGSASPLPLSLLGDGTARAFNIMLTLAYSTNGVLLIDEIENGLHYSVLVDIWKTIFNLAQRINVQVFATTHSWECIQSFSDALHSNDSNDGQLVRLESKNSAIVSTVFDKRGVGIVKENWIEVR